MGLMRKKLLRNISRIIAAVMLIGLFAGCAQKNGDTSQSVSGSQGAAEAETGKETAGTPKKVETVKFLSGIGAYKTLLEQQIEKFNSTTGAEKGVKLEIETQIDKNREVLELAIRAGNSPDLFFMPPGQEAAYVANKWVMPLEDIPEAAQLLERFQPYVKNLVNIYDAKTYALPLEVVPIKMAYNKDLFKKAGIVDANGVPTPPKTWNEVADFAKRITDKGEGKEYGIGYSWAFSVGFRRLVIKAWEPSVGHFWFDNKTGKYNFTDFKPAFEFLERIKKDGSYFPGPESIQIDPIRAQFAEGRIGMMVAPSYDIGVYNDQFPAKCDWGICNMPVVNPEDRYKEIALNRFNVSIAGTVSKERLPAVFEAFNFLHSKEYYTTLYENCAIIPPEQDIIANAKNVQDKKGWKEMSDISVDYLLDPWPDARLTIEGDDAQKVMAAIWAGAVSIDAGLADLDKRYNEALDKAVKDGKVKIEDYLTDQYTKIK